MAIDGANRAKLNSEFARRIEASMDNPFDVVIETKPGAAESVANGLPGIDGAELEGKGVVSDTFVSARLTEGALRTVTQLDEVVLVHQDQLVGVKGIRDRIADATPFSLPRTPTQTSISEFITDAYAAEDPFLGPVGISSIEQPRVNLAQLPPGDPIRTIKAASNAYGDDKTSGDEYIPTGDSVEWMLNGEATIGAKGESAKAAIIDTGHTPVEPSNRARIPRLESMVPGEPPMDGHGHGSWCSHTVAGGRAPSTWGEVRGMAPESKYGHFKALNTFPGFGKTSWILRAMTRANEWGADVISMSLGGAQQGPLDEDPYARFIRRNCKENAGDDEGSIFVAAAGNAGPGKWEIGSPGVAEKALTVASWSLTDAAPAFYSSRGPQGDWYKRNPERFSEDKGEYGPQEVVKPDVVAPGGGRETKAKDDQRGELLHQSSVGWMEGLFDGLKDGRGLMKGTSMACPHVAGFVTRLYDAGIIKTAAEVKQVVRNRGNVTQYPTAGPHANEADGSKNITVGFGPIRESLFDV